MAGEMPFTGERYVPSVTGNIQLEHMHRYHMALRYVAGKDVLDIACGEGFGAALLGTAARSVVGVDIAAEAVAHAAARYGRDRLRFVEGSVTAVPLPDASVDVVVSFETIEHVAEHDAMLAELRRVLRPGGVLLISTPDKAEYTDATGLTNPFHVKELYRSEFRDLLARHFRHCRMHGQRIGFGSLIACEEGAAPAFEARSDGVLAKAGLIAPLYLIAVASDDPEAVQGVTSVYSQDIMASEPVLVRVDHERAAWEKGFARRLEAELAVAEAGYAERLESARVQADARLAAAEADFAARQVAAEARAADRLAAREAEVMAAAEARLQRVQAAAAEAERKAAAAVPQAVTANLRELARDIAAWSGRIGQLRRDNWQNRAGLGKVLKRLLVSRLLYRLAAMDRFSPRRRDRFLHSARKRDPLLLSAQVETICTEFERKLAHGPALASLRRAHLANLNLRVTAIVPNYNHARFLRQRLDSIIAQTHEALDIVVLDDASTDDSRTVIADYLARFPDRIRAVFNAQNSGNVFAQWQAGLAEARGDLVWICESDDFCEPDFLEHLLPAFADQSVMMAFGRIHFVDEGGSYQPGLDSYREAAEPGIWDAPLVRPAAEWFSQAMGVKNVIPNVGGCVFRRQDILPEHWARARAFRVMGDWYLYSVLPAGGQIAYHPEALAFFRVHQKNTSVLAQKTAEYYREYHCLMVALRERWALPEATLARFVDSCRDVFDAAAPPESDFDALIDRGGLLAVTPASPHVLMVFLGFSFGGGELFPIHLANALRRAGVTVSMLQLMSEEDKPEVRAMLDPGIAVYSVDMLRRHGMADVLRRAGVTVIHSHIASAEMILLDEGGVDLPYVATLHGSYEAMRVPARQVAGWLKRVDHFVYLAERNLEPLRAAGVEPKAICKFRNAMPLDSRPFPLDRAALGIEQDAVVFALVGRAIPDKGWVESVAAFRALAEAVPDQDMALLMIGDGPTTQAARLRAEGEPRIHFLGYQTCISGAYRLADVALVPTRFAGESYPLCLIQAMQVGCPAITTDVGEIASMMRGAEGEAGLVLPPLVDDAAFVQALTGAMRAMLDPALRAGFAAGAARIGAGFSLDALAADYAALYADVAARRG